MPRPAPRTPLPCCRTAPYPGGRVSETLVQHRPPPAPPAKSCEGCGKTDCPLVKDHCHAHGWIRAKVCSSCNGYLSYIDRRARPRVEQVLLATLLALRNRCPECIPLEVSELRAPEPKAYRPGSPVVQLRVPKDTLARLDSTRGEETRSAWVLRLIDRELHGQAHAGKPDTGVADSPPGPLALPGGQPCPGTACAGPGCWNRDTARYGLRRLPLCTACAAALQGSRGRSTSARSPRVRHASSAGASSISPRRPGPSRSTQPPPSAANPSR